MTLARPSLIEFPADDPERARRFWSGVLDAQLTVRSGLQGEGWQTHGTPTDVGIHARGRGPGDSYSLPYFTVADLAGALLRVVELGGVVIHPGERFAVCRDSEGSPFGLAHDDPASEADPNIQVIVPDGMRRPPRHRTAISARTLRPLVLAEGPIRMVHVARSVRDSLIFRSGI